VKRLLIGDVNCENICIERKEEINKSLKRQEGGKYTIQGNFGGAYIMTQKERKKRKTPFSGYNLLKFSVLGVLYKQKREDNNKYLDAKQILEKLYEDLEYDKTKYRKHTPRQLSKSLIMLARYKNKNGKVYLLRKKIQRNKQKTNVYAISENGIKLYIEMRDYGLKAPRERYLKIRGIAYLRLVVAEQKAFFGEDYDYYNK